MSGNRNAQLIALVVLILVMVARIIVTGINHWRIIDAIYAYQTDCREQGKSSWVTYSDMEAYSETLWRVWNWSEIGILDPYKYATIKPYIDQTTIADQAQKYVGHESD